MTAGWVITIIDSGIEVMNSGIGLKKISKLQLRAGFHNSETNLVLYLLVGYARL